MNYFDNSLVYFNQSSSATKTYKSYMCPSKDSYFIQDNDKYEDSSNNFNCFWNGTPDKYTQSRPPHISKLRNILSETISDITRDNKLQKGESVELTLEIELMTTGSNTPTNPLVEVTIMQHNKVGTLTSNNFVSPNKVRTNKIPFYTETISSASESASQKRRNWFQRVIRPNDANTLIEEFPNRKMEQINEYNWKTKDNTLYNNTISTLPENNNKTTKNLRSNFFTVLPEEITINGDYTKGYRKVSPVKRTPRNLTKLKKPRNVMTASRKDSLVKKLSDIFLPTRKAGKTEAVKTALTALKQEVDNMKLKNEKDAVSANSRKRKRAHVHNLGKLVSNILVDVMENSNYASSNEVEDNSLPVQYQSFFEPITKRNSKNIQRKLNNRKAIIHEKKVCESYSDTCCLYPKQRSSSLTKKASNSVSDCRAHSHTQTEKLHIGDSSQVFSTKINTNSDKNYRRSQRKNAKGDAKSKSHHVSSKSIKYSKHKSFIQGKSSLIQWNGQMIPVNKEVKARIELLIVNELQNLALKEGMECDVTPLPSTDNSTNNVEKMSSFICELDISDKMFQKVMKKSDSTLANQVTKLIGKKSQKRPKPVKMSKTTKESGRSNKNKKSKVIQDSSGTSNDNALKLNEEQNNELERTNSSLLKTNKEEENDVQVTYLNTNVKNWSAESNTVQFESPEMKESQLTKSISKESQLTKLISKKESQIFQFGASQSCYQQIVSSGFVKRIESDDSTWKDYLSKGKIKVDRNSSMQSSKQLVTVTSTRTTVKLNSTASNEYESSIEIELDIKDLEMILKEAKQKQKAEKILISAKCKHDNKKQKKHIKFTGKNSPSYTNQLLISAAKKLEKYVKKR